MKATDIIEQYQIPREFHEAIFLAYDKGAEDMMLRLASKYGAGGKKSSANLTPEQRRERARKAGQASARKRRGK